MPLPIIPFILKILVLKVFKGAFIGFARYFLRIFRKKQFNEMGDTLTGLEHINQVVNVEWKKKDNLIFLIIMLASALYGLQEMLVWVWVKYAKWRRTIFFTFTPHNLEQVDDFVRRIHGESWFKILYKITRWVLTASLFYWPKNNKNIELVKTDDNKWVKVIRFRKTYWLKINTAAHFHYGDMDISINENGDVAITLYSGEYIAYKNLH